MNDDLNKKSGNDEQSSLQSLSKNKSNDRAGDIPDKVVENLEKDPTQFKKASKYKSSTFNQAISELGPYLNLGVQIAATVGVCALIGWWLDKKLDTKPILLLVFSLTGVGLGIYNFFRNIAELEKRKKDRKSSK